MYDIFSISDFKFPNDFLWGTSTAGHQIEGNNVHSQNWEDELNRSVDDEVAKRVVLEKR
ncbi:MAG: family 1 glycosylhydrolase [Clostridia bacterium]|nr:family 1 glycosylhydrolase [Clostridia bacterium]